MKKSVLFIIVVLFYFGNPHPAVAQNSQVVANGGITSLLSFNGCQTSWTNDNPAIGLPASGVGDIASFRAIKTSNLFTR